MVPFRLKDNLDNTHQYSKMHVNECRRKSMSLLYFQGEIETKLMHISPLGKLTIFIKNLALADTAQWIEHRPANQRVASSIPSQGTCLGGRLSPRSGHVLEATDHCFSLTWMFLSLSFYPAFLSLKRQ